MIGWMRCITCEVSTSAHQRVHQSPPDPAQTRHRHAVADSLVTRPIRAILGTPATPGNTRVATRQALQRLAFMRHQPTRCEAVVYGQGRALLQGMAEFALDDSAMAAGMGHLNGVNRVEHTRIALAWRTAPGAQCAADASITVLQAHFGAAVFRYRVLQISAPRATGVSNGGGQHASPRAHLRRGHVRRLEERTVWVRPAMVNAGATAAVGKVEKEYSITPCARPESSRRWRPDQLLSCGPQWSRSCASPSGSKARMPWPLHRPVHVNTVVRTPACTWIISARCVRSLSWRLT